MPLIDPTPVAVVIEGASEDFRLNAADPGDVAAPKDRRFSITAYTGVAVRLANLPLPVVFDLAGMTAPRQDIPILRNHDPDRIVGHSTAVEITAQRVRVAGVVSGSGLDAVEVLKLADKGYPWQASIGAVGERMELVDRGEKVTVNGRPFTGPLYVARATKLRETSFVAMGADGGTSVALAATAAGQTPGPGELSAAFRDLRSIRTTAAGEQNRYFKASVHEAAHAVVAYRRGIRLAGVGLTAGDPLGYGLTRLSSPPVHTATGLMDLMAVAAAGAVADGVTDPGQTSTHGSDLNAIATARRGLNAMLPGLADRDVCPFLAARHDLSVPAVWGAVIALAGVIRKEHWLDGPDAERIIAASLADPYLANAYGRYAPAPS